ncbi:MAG: hypothetical protein ABIW80_15390 [Lapillicoccus sp.]
MGVRRFRADTALPLVAALLDQRSVCGLGNLWVNELGADAGDDRQHPTG